MRHYHNITTILNTASTNILQLNNLQIFPLRRQSCSFHLVEIEHQQNPNETLLGRQVRR